MFYVTHFGINSGFRNYVKCVHLCKPLQSACSCLRSLFLSGVSSLFDDEFLETMISDKNSLLRLECVVIKSEVSFFSSIAFNPISSCCFQAVLTRKSLENLLKYCLNIEKIDASSWNISQADLLNIRTALTRRSKYVQIL